MAGFTVRSDMLGVTSIVRALNLNARYYNALVDHFHSAAAKLDQLTTLWAQVVLRVFPQPVRINGRRVLVGDGIKVPKCGRKMHAVKLLHQQSEANTKPEYIMGHSLQAVGILVHAASSFFAIPLAIRIHEGLVWSNRDRRTLLDKMLALLGIVAITEPCYFVADAYYAAHKIVAGLLRQNNHLVTRMKSNAVAYTAHHQRGPGREDRQEAQGALAADDPGLPEAKSPVYGENKVIIQYRVRDLLWRPAGRLVRFVAVIHPARGACLLMCTDTSLQAVEIIRLYGLRFKIEHTFKQAVRQIGAFTYHFWISDMKPLRRNNGNQHLHRASLKYRNDVKRKLHAYHVFIQAGLICQGLLQYLSVAFPQLVWSSFGSWLRTIRPGIPPSELVVELPRYVRGCPNFSSMLTKTTSSRNSSPNDRTPTKCRPSASPPNRKPRTHEILEHVGEIHSGVAIGYCALAGDKPQLRRRSQKDGCTWDRIAQVSGHWLPKSPSGDFMKDYRVF